MKRYVTAAALLGLLSAVLLVAAEQARPAPAPADDPRFEFLKSLAGTWVVEPGPGEPGGGIVEFRVTAGGHAVEEREMVGTPMEMLTVYNMDGQDLRATHFCLLGNQPRVTAAPRLVNGSLSFLCDGHPGNTRSHAEEHVHGWAIQRNDDDTVVLTGEVMKDGTSTEAPRFVVTRQPETATR